MIQKLDLKDKIILYLSERENQDKDINDNLDDFNTYTDKDKEGIKNIIKKLEKDDFIEEIEDKEGILGKKLTEKGKEKHEEVWSKVKDKKYLLSDDKDSIELSLSEITRVIEKRPILDILSNVSENGTINFERKDKDRDDLVGRDEELEKLERSVDKLKDSNGATHFILGSTGIGKTRLSIEIKDMADSKNIDFIRGRCSIEEYKPYKPFREALNKFIECGRKIDEDRNMVVNSNEKDVNIKDKEMFDALKKSTFFETTQYLKRLSSHRPLVIFLDDLQWADKGSLNLLDYMTDRLQDEPILFICTYRPGDVPSKHPLKETVRRMSRKKTFKKIELDPLEKEEISKLIENITEIHDIPHSFVDQMLEKTNGNPLFIKESIKQMLEEEIIDKENGKFPDPSDVLLIPDLIEDVIKRRIAHFEDETRKILQLGSVIGKRVPFDLLVKASDMDDLELLDHIDTLIDSNLLFEESQAEAFCFSHDLIVDTIYNGTGRWLERKLLHKQVGEALEELHEDGVENKYSTLAYHFRKGEEFSKSFEYYVKSGKQAESVFAHEDAIEKYNEALKLTSKIEDLEDEKIFYSMEKLADTYSIIGDYKNSRDYFKQAIPKAVDPEGERRIYRKIAQTWTDQGEYENAIKIIKKGLNINEELVDEESNQSISPETCKLLSQKGWAKRRQGKFEEAYEIFRKELDMAEEVGDKSYMSQAYHDLGTSAKRNKDYEKGIEYLEKAIEIREDIDDKKGLSKSLNNLGILYHQLGDLDKASEYFEKSYEIDKETGRKIGVGRSLHNLGLLYQNKGELEKSKEFYNRGIDIKTKIGDKHGISRVENSLGLLEKEKGEFNKSINHLNRCIKISKNIEDYFTLSMGYNNLAEVYILKGELEKAEEFSKKSLDTANEIDNDVRKSQCFSVYGKILRLKGNVEKSINNHEKGIDIGLKLDYREGTTKNWLNLAESYIVNKNYESAEEQLELVDEKGIDTPGFRTKKNMVKAILLRETGRLDESKELFENTLDEIKEINKKYREAELYYELGILKKKQDEASKSEEYIKKALEMSKEMDMNLLKKKSEESLKHISDSV